MIQTVLASENLVIYYTLSAFKSRKSLTLSWKMGWNCEKLKYKESFGKKFIGFRPLARYVGQIKRNENQKNHTLLHYDTQENLKKSRKKAKEKRKVQKVNLVQRFIAMQTLIYFMAILFSQFCWIFYGIMIKGLSHVFIAVVSLWINWAKFHFYYIFIFIVLNINTKGFYHWTALIFVQCRSGGRASWSGQYLCMDSHPDNLSANIHLCLSMCDWWTWDARPKVSTLNPAWIWYQARQHLSCFVFGKCSEDDIRLIQGSALKCIAVNS